MDTLNSYEEGASLYAEDLKTIKEHLDTKFLDALKRRFDYHRPSIVYARNEHDAPVPGQDYQMVMLNAAVRDGQREVIATLEYILTH